MAERDTKLIVPGRVVETELRDCDDESLTPVIQRLCNSLGEMWESPLGTNRMWTLGNYTEYKSARSYQKSIFVKVCPIVSITAIYEDSDRKWGADSLEDSDDYTFDPTTGQITMDGYFGEGNRHIKVVYRGGYADYEIPLWLQHLFARQVAHWYQQGKNKNWDLTTSVSASGTQSYTKLRMNLLPEFEEAMTSLRYVEYD